MGRSVRRLARRRGRDSVQEQERSLTASGVRRCCPYGSFAADWLCRLSFPRLARRGENAAHPGGAGAAPILRGAKGRAVDIPSFIQFFAEKIGKPVSTFAQDDWKRAALTAARLLDEAIPAPKPRGRPAKQRGMRLSQLLKPDYWPRSQENPVPKRPPGRPRSTFGRRGLPIEAVAELFDSIRSPAVRKRWPNEAPRTKIDAMRVVLRRIGHLPDYAESVLRSVRDLRKRK